MSGESGTAEERPAFMDTYDAIRSPKIRALAERSIAFAKDSGTLAPKDASDIVFYNKALDDN